MASNGRKRKIAPRAKKARNEESKADQLPEIAPADSVEDAEVMEESAPDNAEPQTDPAPETDPAEPEQAAAQAARPARAWPAMLFGGILAGAVGFAASQYLGNDRWPFGGGPSRLDEISAKLAEQTAMLQETQKRLDEFAAAQAGFASLAEIKTLEDALATGLRPVSELSSRIDELEKRITDLENRPIPDGSATKDAVAAYERQLEAMRQMFQSELDRIRELQASVNTARTSALQAEKSAAALSAMAQLIAAGENGQPFKDVLDDLKAAGLEPPASLAEMSETGITTLAQLQDSFPDTARKALAVSADSGSDGGETGTIAGFLKRQLGARSLEPREGNDPDAILSRAEAAVKSGDLEAALKELDALPDAGRDAVAPWTEKAGRRLEALHAIQNLASKLEEQGQ